MCICVDTVRILPHGGFFFFFFNPDGKINLGNNGKVDYEGDVEKEIICLDETLSLHTLV